MSNGARGRTHQGDSGHTDEENTEQAERMPTATQDVTAIATTTGCIAWRTNVHLLRTSTTVASMSHSGTRHGVRVPSHGDIGLENTPTVHMMTSSGCLVLVFQRHRRSSVQ